MFLIWLRKGSYPAETIDKIELIVFINKKIKRLLTSLSILLYSSFVNIATKPIQNKNDNIHNNKAQQIRRSDMRTLPYVE